MMLQLNKNTVHVAQVSGIPEFIKLEQGKSDIYLNS